jgi:hypothetical protein
MGRLGSQVPDNRRKYNPEAMDDRHKGAGAMQRSQGWRRPCCSVRSIGGIASDPDAQQKARRGLPPGRTSSFQFRECTESHARVKHKHSSPSPDLIRGLRGEGGTALRKTRTRPGEGAIPQAQTRGNPDLLPARGEKECASAGGEQSETQARPQRAVSFLRASVAETASVAESRSMRSMP